MIAESLIKKAALY